MLVAAPKELYGKYKYENGVPVPDGELTEEEQEAFDKFLAEEQEAEKMRFSLD